MVTNFARKSSVVWRWMAVCLLAAALAAPMGAAAQTTFSRIVVFGDSLSDPGNDFALINTQNTPPYDNLDPLTIIPHAPWSSSSPNAGSWHSTLPRVAERRHQGGKLRGRRRPGVR
jgi:phospholipase/lecithinase/hemolysin